MMQLTGILCGVVFVGFIIFAFRQGMKVTPDGSGNATNNQNIYPGGDS
jgi:hypothetical protein